LKSKVKKTPRQHDEGQQLPKRKGGDKKVFPSLEEDGRKIEKRKKERKVARPLIRDMGDLLRQDARGGEKGSKKMSYSKPKKSKDRKVGRIFQNTLVGKIQMGLKKLE